MAYALGAVKPFVQDVANKVGPKYKPTAIYGWRATAHDMEGHPAGLALDFTVGSDRAKGDAIAALFVQHADVYMVRYVIWQQRIWKPGGSWTLMERRPDVSGGGTDANHLRHVHVSFRPEVADGRRLGGSAPTGVTGMIGDLVDGAGNVAQALNPMRGVDALAERLTGRDTWLRVGQVLGGAAAIVLGVSILFRDVAAAGLGAVASATPTGRAAGAVAGAGESIKSAVTAKG